MSATELSLHQFNYDKFGPNLDPSFTMLPEVTYFVRVLVGRFEFLPIVSRSIKLEATHWALGRSVENRKRAAYNQQVLFAGQKPNGIQRKFAGNW